LLINKVEIKGEDQKGEFVLRTYQIKYII